MILGYFFNNVYARLLSSLRFSTTRVELYTKSESLGSIGCAAKCDPIKLQPETINKADFTSLQVECSQYVLLRRNYDPFRSGHCVELRKFYPSNISLSPARRFLNYSPNFWVVWTRTTGITLNLQLPVEFPNLILVNAHWEIN